MTLLGSLLFGISPAAAAFQNVAAPDAAQWDQVKAGTPVTIESGVTNGAGEPIMVTYTIDEGPADEGAHSPLSGELGSRRHVNWLSSGTTFTPDLDRAVTGVTTGPNRLTLTFSEPLPIEVSSQVHSWFSGYERVRVSSDQNLTMLGSAAGRSGTFSDGDGTTSLFWASDQMPVSAGGWWGGSTTDATSISIEYWRIHRPGRQGGEFSDNDGEYGREVFNIMIETPPIVSAAVPDEDLGNTLGEAVTVSPAANDRNIDATTIALVDPATGTSGPSVTVPGEGVWTVDAAGDVTFTPEAGFVGDPTPLTYEITGIDGEIRSSTITITYLVEAVDDEDLGNTVGTAVTVDAAGNDSPNTVASTLQLIDPATGATGTSVTVPGEGTWATDGAGMVTFTPEAGFNGDPTPLDYEIANANGETATATITITYLPEAIDDEDLGNTVGTAVTVDAAGNDSPNTVASTLQLIDPATGATGTSVTVPGEGTWTTDGAGMVTFTPEAGFTGDPTPLDYEIANANGDKATATVTITYVSAIADPPPSAIEATDDAEQADGTDAPVTLTPSTNDIGDVVPTSIKLVDPVDGSLVDEVVVPGEGTWAVQPNGDVVFTPETGYLQSPTPLSYEIADAAGNTDRAVLTIINSAPALEIPDYQSLDNQPGTPVTQDLADPNNPDLLPDSFRLIDPATNAPGDVIEVMGEGIWRLHDQTMVTFTPAAELVGDPTPIQYQATDVDGLTAQGQVAVTYIQALAFTGSDASLGLLALMLMLIGLTLTAGTRLLGDKRVTN